MAAIVKRGVCNADVLRNIIFKFMKKEVDVTSFVAEPATAKGNNFISDAWRIQYTIHENGQKINDSMFVKAKPEDEAKNTLMHTDIAFKNEVLAYERVIPSLNKYSGAPMRVPRYFHGDANNIVLEDMCKSGYQIPTKKLATEWNQVWSPIQEMAKLHAASITMQHVAPDEFQKLKDEITEVPFPESEPLGEKQATILDTILEVLRERNEGKKYVEVVEELKKDAWKLQKDILQKDVPIRVINHGSIWVNNTLFKNDMITLLDLQHITYSTPANDLSFFLYVNLDPDFLANKRNILIKFYLLNLHQSITDSLGAERSVPVLSPLNYDWIDKELKRCSLYAYMMAQWIMPVFYWSENVFRQMETKGGLENMSIPERLSYINPEQKDRIFKLTKLFASESKSYKL